MTEILNRLEEKEDPRVTVMRRKVEQARNSNDPRHHFTEFYPFYKGRYDAGEEFFMSDGTKYRCTHQGNFVRIGEKRAG